MDGSGRHARIAAPWSLFLIMFVWQLPHFLAIAWLYREDYARAGLPMLPVVDKDGVLTGGQAALWAATLVPVTRLPYLLRFMTAHLCDRRARPRHRVLRRHRPLHVASHR